jgi:hypothetical protein
LWAFRSPLAWSRTGPRLDELPLVGANQTRTGRGLGGRILRAEAVQMKARMRAGYLSHSDVRQWLRQERRRSRSAGRPTQSRGIVWKLPLNIVGCLFVFNFNFLHMNQGARSLGTSLQGFDHPQVLSGRPFAPQPNIRVAYANCGRDQQVVAVERGGAFLARRAGPAAGTTGVVRIDRSFSCYGDKHAG